MIEFFGKKLNTYRTNLHTHSTTSDGKYTPDEVMKIYADEGYDVLCMTDHLKVNRMAEIDSHGMLALCGVELHPSGGRIVRSHLLAVDVPEDFDTSVCKIEAPGCIPMQKTIDAVNEAGGLCFFAHPYWCGFRADEVAQLRGLAGIEVYNTSTRYIGRAYNMQIWDELCDMGTPYPAIAVDDVHKAHDLFGGWTEICAEERTHDAVMAALRSGSYYATQGPKFTRISYENGIFEAEFTPVTSAIGIANQCKGCCGAVPNKDGDGLTPEVTSIRCDLRTLFPASPLLKVTVPCTYFRCQIIDAQGRHAWTNPIRVNRDELFPTK